MSLFDRFKKKAEDVAQGVWRQANPFDGGKTYSNPQPRPQVTQQAPQQAYRPPASNMLQGTRPNPMGANVAAPSLIPKMQQPQLRVNQIPSYGNGLQGFINKAKDIVDANTPQDQFKRNQTVKAPLINQTYQQQQATNPNAINKMAQAGFGAVNRVASPVKANIDLARAGAAQLTGNQQARNSAFQSAMANSKVLGTDIKNFASSAVESPRVIGRGLAAISPDQRNAEKAQQAYIDQLNQQKLNAINRAKQGFNTQQDINRFTNYADNLWNNESQARQQQIQGQQEKYKTIDPVRQAAAIADTGLTATSFLVAGATRKGAQAAASKAFEQSLAQNVPKELALQTAKRAGLNEIIRQSALAGSMSGAQGVVTPYATKDPGTVTPKDVISSSATNALLGGAMPGTFVGLSKAVDPIQNALKNTGKALDNFKVGPTVAMATPDGQVIRVPKGQLINESIAQEPSGKRYVKVDTAQELFDNAPKTEHPKIARKYIQDNFRGKSISIDENNNIYFKKPLEGKYTRYPGENQSMYYGLKMRLAPELDNAVKISEFRNKMSDKKGIHNFAKNGWEYRTVEFEHNGKRYAGVLNIANDQKGKSLYDINNIKELPANGANARLVAGSSNPTITNNPQNVNPIRGLDRLKPNQKGFARSTEESPVLKKLGIVKDGKAMSVDPLEALKQEARKYKSAEEFINSQKSVYHGTNADITEFGQLKGGRERGEFSATNSLFASENPELAGAYGKNLLEGKNTGKVLDTTTLGNKLDPNERVIPDEFADYKTNPILEPRDRRVLEESYFKSGTPSNITIDHLPNIQEYFRSKGYSAIQIPRASDVNGAATEMVIIDPTKIKTKQQLTDLYNQATAPKSAPIEKTPTELPKNQAESVVPEQNLSQKSQQQSQLPQTETSPMTSKNTSEPIIPTNSVKSPEGFIPEAKKMAQGKEVKQETSKLIDSAKKSDVIPDEVIAGIDPTRSVKSNKESWNDAGQKLHLLGDDGALQYFHENHTDEANFVAWRLYEKRQARGDIEGASQLLAEMASRSIENGRATQAWNAMRRLDPKYIVQKLQTQVDNLMKGDKLSDRLKKRVDWSAEKQARITKLAGNLGNDTVMSRVTKATTPEQVGEITGVVDKKFLKALADEKDADRVKMLLSANFREEINSIIPSKAGDKAVAYWKASLLSAPVTQVRNITGNLINVTANTVETPIAGVLDATLGRLLTPTKRTVSGNPFVGTGRGLKQGASDFKDAVKYGITEDEATKFDYKTINWNKNNPIEQRVIKPFTDAIFRTLGAEDKIFKAPGVIHSLYNQAEAAAISAGKKGDAEWMANWVKNAPAPVKEQALKEGKVWVFQKDTVVSDAMRGLKNSVKRNHPGWEKAVEAIQPFVNVPAAIGSELMTYTPAGLLRVTNKARKAVNKNIDLATRDIYRREAMKDLSKTTIGGGIITAGIAMGYAGQATGNMPPKNTKEYDEWLQENKQPNSIRIGNKWLNINSLGPQMALFNAAAQTGAQWRKAQDEGKPADLATNAVRFTGNVATNWFNASSLTGAANAQKALSDPVRYGQDYIARQGTSFIPNFAKRWGAGIDQYARDPQSFKDAVLANIPIARTNTPIKVDSTGTPVVNNSYGAFGLKSLFDPVNIATARDGGIAPVSKQNTIQTGGMPTSETDRAARVKDMKNTLQTKLYDGRYKGKTNAQLEDLANYGDTDAQDLLNSLEAVNKRFAKPEKPTPNLSSSAQNILNEEKKYTETGKAAWLKKENTDKNISDSLNAWRPTGAPEIRVTNEIAKKWAEYQKDFVSGNIPAIEVNKKKKALLTEAYKTGADETTKAIFDLSTADIIGGVKSGSASIEQLKKAVELDNMLVATGLSSSASIQKAVRNEFGLGLAPSKSGTGSGSSKKGRKGKKTKLPKYTSITKNKPINLRVSKVKFSPTQKPKIAKPKTVAKKAKIA